MNLEKTNGALEEPLKMIYLIVLKDSQKQTNNEKTHPIPHPTTPCVHEVLVKSSRAPRPVR